MNNSILLLDNFDSFTYNLYHLLYTVSGVKPVVLRNDLPDPRVALKYSTIVLSPGPGLPEEAGNLMEVIHQCWGKTKILGVCLGHQALAIHSGGKLNQLDHVYHGVSRQGLITERSTLFEGIDKHFEAGSYHSWTVDKANLNDQWKIIAEDQAGEILAMEHQSLPVTGIQFHPESVLTPQGNKMIENWLKH
jgi:anthranilate synthase component 2